MKGSPAGVAVLKWKPIALAATLLLLAMFPLAGSGFYVELVAKVMILAIFALSLDLLVGYTGLVSFGHAAFFGIGAYTLGLMAPKYEAANLWLTLPAAMLAAAIAAFVVGLFVVRVKGIYFIMVTLAFAVTLWQTTLQERIPREALSRVFSYDWVGSLVLMPLGFAVAGPLAMAIGIDATLWLAAGLLFASSIAVALVPGVRRITRRDEAAPLREVEVERVQEIYSRV